MKQIFTLLVLLTGHLLFSQTGPYWLLKGGGVNNDEGLDISIDAAGNSYSTGYFSGVSQFGPNITLTSNGITDVFIAKVDSLGNYLWVVKAGGFGPDRGNSIITDAQGNSYITGYYQSSATFGSTVINSAGSSQDIFLAKYNNQGVLQWVVSAGGPLGDIGNAVTLDNAGNVYLTGQFMGTASFGSVSLTSATDPNTGTPSYDVFTAKYNASNGNVIWAKKGSAPYTDRGLDIACDVAGNVYVTGQFSDTITFDVTHNNNMYNCIFLIKYSAAGVEQWFRKMGGSTQCISYGIAVDNNSDIYVTGDFLNQLIFFGTTNYTLSNTYPDCVFLAKYNSSGNLLWAKSEGSNSEVTSRNIVLDNIPNVYITGSFKCRFNSIANTYGQGTFNSVGYWDIFAAKFDASGNRLWAQQSGGKKDDRSYGITVNKKKDVIVCGGFYDRINFPASINFLWPGAQYSNIYNYFPPITYCSDNNYEQYYYMTSAGVSDIFICKGFDPARSPYDYYQRDNSTTCLRPYKGVKLLDSIVVCGNIGISVLPNTGMAGPDYTYLWTNGLTTPQINVNSSGLYSVTQTSEDGCFVSSDTIIVNINPNPTLPTITDSHGININAVVTTPIHLCLPDSVILTAGNICSGCTGYWTGAGTTISPNSIKPIQTGTYYFYVTDMNGCVSGNSISVVLDTVLIMPSYVDSHLTGPDTVYLCQGDHFSLFITDTMFNNPYPDSYYQHFTNWNANPYVPLANTSHVASGYPTQTGLYTINEEHIIILENFCNADTLFFYDTISVYAIVYPGLVITTSLSGNMTICPGDTTIITAATNGNPYVWSGPGIVGVNNQLSVVIASPGSYSFSAWLSDTNGCGAQHNSNFTIANKPNPVVTTNPSSGVICPNDSVTLICIGNGTHSWFGPAGHFAGNQQSVIVNTSGFYYCVLTDIDNCSLVSNTVEVIQYSTPYLLGVPSSAICPGESVTLNVIASIGSIVQWQPPLSGSLLSQVITTPGTYSCTVISCGITTQTSINITLSNFSANITSSAQTICYGDSAILIAGYGGSIFHWSNGSNTSSIVVYQPGTYSVTVTDNNGCILASAPFTIGGSLIAPPVVNDQTLCYGMSAGVHASSSGPIQWFANPSGGTPLYTGSDFITPPVTGNITYYLQTYDLVCPSPRIPVHINIFPGSEVPVITSNSPLCIGDTLNINVVPDTAATYSWTGPGGFVSDSPAIYIPDATIFNSGTYTLVASSDSCPDQTVNVNIEVDIYPVAGFNYSLEPICEGVRADLSSTSQPSTGVEWYFSDGFISNSPALSHVFNYNDTAILNLIAFNNSCRDTTQVIIPMIFPDLITLPPPNVFTPNDDGINDCFHLKTSPGYADCYQMEIYNRWGRRVFLLDSENTCWNGKNQNDGKDCADGVYYFIITLGSKSYQGSVTLLR